MPNRLKPIARKLRINATDAERRLWNGVRREQIGGFKFRRQVILNGFVADFTCYEARLVIEVDGATHSTEAERARDAMRSAALDSQGYGVLRFTNDEVFRNIDGVLETIRLKLIELRPRVQDDAFEGGATPLPNPPPQGLQYADKGQGPEPCSPSSPRLLRRSFASLTRLDCSARLRLWAIHDFAAQSRLESRLLSTKAMEVQSHIGLVLSPPDECFAFAWT